MDPKKIIEDVNSLIQLDIDAFHAYGQAISAVTTPSVREQLARYQADHERHVLGLSAAVLKMGGTPPDFSRDFKGFLIEGITALRSITGTKGALEAMRTNEKLTNKRYAEARQWAVPADLKTILERNLEDERTHLAYIENALKARVWEAPKGAEPESRTHRPVR